MRPLRLAVRGISAFRDEQVIDFEGLDLFAIAGPTGSGKSSLLDAMTYALYGEIERVGNRASLFISQGQTRMSVCFDFAVDQSRWRVTRSTPVKGATKILLERWDGESWEQAGPGADRVRDAEKIIRSTIGLDYEAFTRTVLLPQGKFAEFLTGDAKERRAILTELLGLELFERLGKRAGELKREAESNIRAKTEQLESEYKDVTAEAVSDAKQVADEAARRESALTEAEVKIRQEADAWSTTSRAVSELRALADDVSEAASVADFSRKALEDLGRELDQIRSSLLHGKQTLEDASQSAQDATSSREHAEGTWGNERKLVELLAEARELVRAQKTHADAVVDLETAQRHLPELEEEESGLIAALAQAKGEADARSESLGDAEAALDRAQHADLVAAVRAGLHVGDACPVCGSAIAKLTQSDSVQPVEAARTELDRAREAKRASEQAVRQGQEALHKASVAVQAARGELEHGVRTLESNAEAMRSREQGLATSMGGEPSSDPIGELEDRLRRLQELTVAERLAKEALESVRREVVGVEHAREALESRVREERVRLESVHGDALLSRARTLAAEHDLATTLGALPKENAPAVLAGAAQELTSGLRAVSVELLGIADELAAKEGTVLERAASQVRDLIGDATFSTIEELVGVVVGALREATRQAAAAHHRLVDLKDKLKRARKIRQELKKLKSRAVLFDALVRELRADRIIAFLQVEALQLLAAAGSERLAVLSSGRYRLEFEHDEFYVVDQWNGEERRSARTLSGGETFLASLALALALSEQVRSLAVSERARLDSLFLDEGFGSLDPETLEIVVEAIEQLGGDGRIVGVITHVHELAIRLPARIAVEKSPRGSRLSVLHG